MIVEVTQKHINKAEEGNPHSCAIAWALREQFGVDEDDVYVDEDEIKVDKSNGFSFHFEWRNLPAKVKAFIAKFDDDKTKAKPFKFKLPFIK